MLKKNGIWQKTAAAILISNKDRHRRLTDYRNRVHIESLFGDERVIPMAEWNKETMKEKICLFAVTGRF